jgi:dCMP deaminase
MDERIPFPLYYLEIAKAVSQRSSCLSKHYGAVIVKNNTIVSTGYNGAPRGRLNCCERGMCQRIANKVKRGTDYNSSCRSCHAEQNAIINASKEEMDGATLYLYGYDMVNDCIVHDPSCCPMCKRMVINAGIKWVVFADPDLSAENFPKQINLGYWTKTVEVQDWIDYDDSLSVLEGY